MKKATKRMITYLFLSSIIAAAVGQLQSEYIIRSLKGGSRQE